MASLALRTQKLAPSYKGESISRGTTLLYNLFSIISWLAFNVA